MIPIARDPLTMCKIFFFSLSPPIKLKTPPHKSSVCSNCVFFLGEPENPPLWYPLNWGHNLDFFLIFPGVLCLNAIVILGSCPLRKRSKEKNSLPAPFHSPSPSPQHALSFWVFCVSPLVCLVCVITVVLFLTTMAL